MEYEEDNDVLDSISQYNNGYDDEENTTISSTNEKRSKLALEKALDIRKFEIELYWKRAGYFWVFIATVFTSYFVVVSGDKTENDLSIILSALGLFLSLCWFFVNKASKYWQENWEKHVDLLEDNYIGPLYKTTLVSDTKLYEEFIRPLKPSKYSVSKINQLLSFSIVLVWIYILLRNVSETFGFYELFSRFNYVVILLFFIVLIICLVKCCKSSDKNGGNFKMKRRKFKKT